MSTFPPLPRPGAASRTMMAIVTVGVGGYDQLVVSRIPVPAPTEGEVLVQVLAAGMNNTEINTRLGWYSPSVTTGTNDAAGKAAGRPSMRLDGGWNTATPFPLIQGTDCCGRIAAVGPAGDESTIGARVLVRPCMRTQGFSSKETTWLGSDRDGAFAEFVVVPADEVFTIECDWSDAELGTVPCAYGTAENMVRRAGISSGARVVVSGASGGVGSAAVQLAKRRGARVTAIASDAKQDMVSALGADEVIGRDDPLNALGAESADVVIDNVAGTGFPAMLGLLRKGGVYVSSGAIGGPLVELDMRTFYLKDLTLIGCTAWDEEVFPDLISYIEGGEIQPLLAKAFPLDQIVDAQREFLEKAHVGNLVLVPPGSPCLTQPGRSI